ncbi:MAG: BON domain-containing protein [Pseudomonadota bacterium]|nr:BON domain-containing protein [Pseudomonadota bacterium]
MNTLKVSQKNAIIEQIYKRLYWDKRVSMVDIQIESTGGEITVRGIVDSYIKKNAALEVVLATEGVRGVNDQVVVNLSLRRPDAEIKSIIRREIDSFSLSHVENIQVNVLDAIVKLSGRVYQKCLKALAASLCWELSGVKDCLNQIVILAPSEGAPAKISVARAKKSLVRPAYEAPFSEHLAYCASQLC